MERFETSGSEQGADRYSAGEVLEWGSRLASELDPRLADVWSCVFSIESDPTLEQLGWFLRMAYLNGYEDGITEITRGKLLQELGMTAPSKTTRNRREGTSDHRLQGMRDVPQYPLPGLLCHGGPYPPEG